MPVGLFLIGLACAAGWGAEPQPAAAPASAQPADSSRPKPAQRPAEKPAPSGGELAALVRQLGNPSYEQRTRASERLTGLGLAARGALMTGLEDADPEIRRRCRWILADVLEADHQRRLEAFVADTDERDDHGLPGWDRYRRLIGSDKAARELFVQMQRAEGGLLASAAIGKLPAAESLKLRFQQVYRLMVNRDPTRRASPSLGSIAALLYVASNTGLDLPPEVADSPYLQNVVHQAEFQKALASGRFKPTARKILGQWILLPGNAGMLASKLQMAIQHDVKEGLYPAVKAAGDKQKAPAHARAYAVSAIGLLGGKPHAARLAALLDDKTECQRHVINNVTFTIQIRDVALAWLIHLTGQKHADYGMDRAKAEFDRLVKHPHRHVNVGNMRFKEGAGREEALKKWKAWAAAHPLPQPPEVAGPAPHPAAKPDAKPDDKPAAQPALAAAGLLPGAVPPRGAGPEDGKPRGLALAAADRLQVRNLSAARQLGRRGHYAEAARLLGGILAAPADYSFRPDPGVPLYRCLKPEAERLIAQLPEQVRTVYRDLFGPQARHLLAEAARSGDPARLREVSECYFHTPAGAKATYLLAAYHLDHGEPFRAALYLDRLRNRSADADRYEPALSLVLAACWSRAAMPEAAEAVLVALRARHPRAAVEVAGRRQELFTEPQRALAWLEALIGPSPKPPAGGGWPMFRGDPSRNLASSAGSPFLDAEPIAPVASHPLVQQTLQKLCKENRQKYRAALPRLHPLVVGQSIVLRTATHLLAIELAGGRVLWKAPLEDSLRYFLRHAPDEQKEAQAYYFSRGLRRRLWEDTCFGTLSSDGRLVFGVEDLAFGFRPDYQRMVVMPDGRRRLDPAWQKDYNLLVAYDVRTGKVQWEIGGPPDMEMIEQAGTYFLGPPLPLGGRLYVVADVGDETRLVELEARTGRLIRYLTLAARPQDPRMRRFMFMPFGLPETVTPRSTASPSYADGVLVCRTSDNQFVGVNLSTRSVQWIYETPRQELGMGPFFGNLWLRKLYEAAQADDDHWADASVTIAEGRILLTPPESGKLICLNLVDGHLEWSVPRRDGLYVAGVHSGRVVVVGRGSVWAVKLADGTAAWGDSPLKLPAGALASGRGLLARDRYYLPLTTAEVVAIDLNQGRFAARSRSPDGIVAGNLIACGGVVLSQDVDGLRRFQTLDERHRQTAVALARKPDDPRALADHGEVLLCQGRLAEAVDHLRRSMKLRPETRTRRMLIDALEDGLRTDFNTFRELAVALDPVIDSPELRRRFLRQLALAHQQAGQVRAAFDTYLELIELEPGAEELEHTSATRVVRRDRWIAARLAELHAAAPPEVRAELDRLLTARLRDGRLGQFLTYFGFHPAADDARLRLARQLSDRKQWAEAEWLLRQVRRSGDELQQRAAVARLAALLRAAEKPEDAARVYRYLAGPLSQAVCADGKTGRQLVEALPPDDPVRRAMAAGQPWPAGQVRVEVTNKRTGTPTRYPMTLTGDGGLLDRPVRVEIDSGGQSLVATDALGRKLWEASPKQQQRSWGYSSVMFSYAQGCLRGHTLLAWLGNRVCAVDALGPEAKVLWVHETVSSEPPIPGMHVIMPWRMQMFRQPRAANTAEPRSLAVTSHCVCFQQEHKLLALDPRTGQLLWSRGDVGRDNDLFGDDEMIFVTASGSREAAVYSAIDGHELGWRQVPGLQKRMAAFGRRLLTWDSNSDGCRLALVDPWTGQVAWQRMFPERARPWTIAGDEVAVLEPQGRLTILRLPSGEVTLQTRLDPQPELDEIVVLRSEDRYVLVANRPGGQIGPILIQVAPGNVAVNGRVYGLDRRSGKKLWSAEVTDQTMRIDQPSRLPVLVFYNALQKQEGNRFKMSQHTLCLDKRNGRVLHRKEIEGGGSAQYRIDSDPDHARIEVVTMRETIKMTFTNDPLKDQEK